MLGYVHVQPTVISRVGEVTVILDSVLSKSMCVRTPKDGIFVEARGDTDFQIVRYTWVCGGSLFPSG